MSSNPVVQWMPFKLRQMRCVMCDQALFALYVGRKFGSGGEERCLSVTLRRSVSACDLQISRLVAFVVGGKAQVGKG